MAVNPILFALFLFPDLFSPFSALSHAACTDPPLLCELQGIQLRISQLELMLEGSNQNLNRRSIYLNDRENLQKELTQKIQYLESLLNSMKGDSSSIDNRLATLDEEVRQLWASSRNNNFDLHLLEFKAQDAEEKLEVVTSKVEKMAEIVTEQWIQIQQLEQALHMTEMRELKNGNQVSTTKCTFWKGFEMLDLYVFGKVPTLSSKVSQTSDQLKRIFKAVQKYHHELQGLIKQEMERNAYTAVLANRELVFFVASALITFPIMGAWMFLSSQFS